MARYAAGYGRVQPIWGEQDAATTATALAGASNISWQKVGDTKAFPSSLPSGVSGFIPTRATITSSNNLGTCWLVRLVDLGSLNISTNTFTDGNAMPTVTELNTSRAMSGIVLMEVTTVLNATPGNLQITYTDQDGNTAESNTAQAFAASAAVGSIGVVNLNSGDTGVRDITNAQRTAGTTPTGVIKLWGVIPVAMMMNTSAGQGETVDLLTTQFCPQLFGTSEQLYVLVASVTAANTVCHGALHVVGDS